MTQNSPQFQFTAESGNATLICFCALV